ncbi:MAG: hypothetical protein GX328_00255 [Clostridiaceae bacterium]|nr:hypothetical protein [Clostridiaceae bacterium]
MKRVKSLGRYQRVVLLFTTVIVLVFTVIYPMTITRKGFLYKDVILTPNQENGNTIYSGKIQGKQASFTVSEDKTVIFQYDDKTFGPYRAKEDSTAIPKNIETEGGITGVELWQGDNIFFRGGVENNGDIRWVFHEDGSVEDLYFSTTTKTDIEIDEHGNVIDTMEPSATVILNLMYGPKLTHKGEWSVWLLGVFICIITVISILFADELFRFGLSFRIRNADQVEPSHWEIIGRHIYWTLLPIFAIIVFILGLQ